MKLHPIVNYRLFLGDMLLMKQENGDPEIKILTKDTDNNVIHFQYLWAIYWIKTKFSQLMKGPILFIKYSIFFNWKKIVLRNGIWTTVGKKYFLFLASWYCSRMKLLSSQLYFQSIIRCRSHATSRKIQTFRGIEKIFFLLNTRETIWTRDYIWENSKIITR